LVPLPSRKTVKFSPNHPILVSGDIKGDIKAYRIFGKTGKMREIK